MTKRLNYIIAISLLLHLVLLFVFTEPAFRALLNRIHPYAPPPARLRPPTLVVQMRRPADFIPTLPSQRVAEANPNAVLESEFNTARRSQASSPHPDSPLPTMTGVNHEGLVYNDTPASPQIDSRPMTPSPATPPQPRQPNTPPPQATTTQPPSPAKPQAVQPPTPPIPVVPGGVPLFPAPQPKPTPQPPSPQNPSPAQTPTEASQAAPPPSTVSIAQQRSAISGGGTPEIGEPSPEAKETEMGKYKGKIYRMIGSRWYQYVETNMTTLAIGQVQVKFFVRANGVIDQVTMASSSGRIDILQGISLKAVSGSYGDVFSDNLKQQLGSEGYWDEITFTIY